MDASDIVSELDTVYQWFGETRNSILEGMAEEQLWKESGRENLLAHIADFQALDRAEKLIKDYNDPREEVVP